MPYIKQADRILLDRDGWDASTPGDLNYQITRLIRDYWRRSKGNYQTINDVMGALTGAQAEFYRRVAAPYEDTKIDENGDVY